MLAEALTHHGFRVRWFTEAELALDAMRTAPPDLLLVDLRMPCTSGDAVARIVRAEVCLRGVVIVGTSGAAPPGDIADLFDDWLPKPVDLVTLPRLLRALADSRASGVR